MFEKWINLDTWDRLPRPSTAVVDVAKEMAAYNLHDEFMGVQFINCKLLAEWQRRLEQSAEVHDDYDEEV
jgi:hypothetical protein